MNYYLYNNLHFGDNLFSRPLIKRLIELNQTVMIGCYKNVKYIFDDLPCEKKVADFNEGQNDLISLCPPDYTPINTWLGYGWRGNDFIGIYWVNIVDLFNEQSQNFKIDYNPDNIPFMDFNVDINIDIPEKTIYIANSPCRGDCSFFIFDLDRIAKTFSQYHFICTYQGCSSPNMLNFSNKNLIELSKASEKCIAFLGKGSAPSDCTIVSSNIGKPRAFCGFHGRGLKPCYPHPKDKTVFLNTMDEVIQFIEKL